MGMAGADGTRPDSITGAADRTDQKMISGIPDMPKGHKLHGGYAEKKKGIWL